MPSQEPHLHPDTALGFCELLAGMNLFLAWRLDYPVEVMVHMTVATVVLEDAPDRAP